MATPEDEADRYRDWRLTADQRHQIYQEEKMRLDESQPVVSKRTKTMAGIYLFGCVLMYFGMPGSVIEFCGTRQWEYHPNPDVFSSLIYAAIQLIGPFLAVVICGWIIAIPVGLVFAIWSWGDDLRRFFKRLANRE